MSASRFAVLCGIPKYDDENKGNLPFIVEDINNLYKLLTQELHPDFRYREENIIVFPPEMLQLTPDKVEKFSFKKSLTLKRLYSFFDELRVKKPEELFFYLAGHGGFFRDKPYVFTYAGEDFCPGLRMSDLAEELEQFGAERVFTVFDFCFSGGVLENFRPNEKVAILTACRKNEVSNAGGNENPSMMKYLVDSWKTAHADEEGIITWGDIALKVCRNKKIIQRPMENASLLRTHPVNKFQPTINTAFGTHFIRCDDNNISESPFFNRKQLRTYVEEMCTVDDDKPNVLIVKGKDNNNGNNGNNKCGKTYTSTFIKHLRRESNLLKSHEIIYVPDASVFDAGGLVRFILEEMKRLTPSEEKEKALIPLTPAAGWVKELGFELIDKIEKARTKNSEKIKNNEKIFWLILDGLSKLNPKTDTCELINHLILDRIPPIKSLKLILLGYNGLLTNQIPAFLREEQIFDLKEDDLYEFFNKVHSSIGGSIAAGAERVVLQPLVTQVIQSAGGYINGNLEQISWVANITAQAMLMASRR